VIELVATVREEFSLGPQVRTRLITNGSLLGRRSVQQGIERLAACEGEVWFKVDAGTRAGFARINGVVLAPQQVATNLRRCARLCPTWVQTCIFAFDGKTPDGAEIEAYIDVLRTAGTDLLAGVLLYGLARPSLQPEAPRLAPAPEAAMAELAARIRELGLTVRVSP